MWCKGELAGRYLTSRFSKLSQDDQKVSLLMDEAYCKQAVHYSNGQFYGKESNEITKTLLCVMIKPVCGKYRDIVAMVPITNIDANKLYTVWKSYIVVFSDIGFDKLYTVWKSYIVVLSDIGFVVVVTMTNGHTSNERFFKRLLGNNNPRLLHRRPMYTR